MKRVKTFDQRYFQPLNSENNQRISHLYFTLPGKSPLAPHNYLHVNM